MQILALKLSFLKYLHYKYMDFLNTFNLSIYTLSQTKQWET